MRFSGRGYGLAAALAYAATMLSSAGSLAGTIIYVNGTTGNDANNGQSWAAAKRSVQAGLNAATAGGEVWVAAGTYVQRITLKAGVGLYGGFAGNEVDRSQRNWAARRTILDGGAGGTVVTSPSGATTTTRIDGFIIRNGASTVSGGGILCSSSSPTIANNTITANSASGGAGIHCYLSSPTIVNNAIMGNSATGSGGGISCSSSSPTIANNTITANSASGGGGIYCYYSSSTIANNIVAFNSSGIIRSVSGTPTLRYNCVYANTAFDYSGVTDPTGTDGNLSTDPNLASLAYGNMHIQPASPCVNAGDDAMVGSGWMDIDGQARILGSHVDIGADESDGTSWPEGPYAIVRVSPAGNDTNNGSSWALAKRTVQAGINAASVLGGEVWVQAGTYNERITLPPFVYLYGGFAGTEVARTGRDWTAQVTILDGQKGGSVVTARAGYRVSRIDGFTIRNGSGTPSSSYWHGGGIYCTSAPTIANNTIMANSADGNGGGVYCYKASPIITSNTIIANGANDGGGGIYCEFSSATIANNRLAGNSAGDGGGIYCIYSSPTITNGTMTANSAYSGGGVYCRFSSPTIGNSTIAGNSASDGGGIYCKESSPAITNTIIAFNSSGIYRTVSGTPTLRYNCVYANTAYDFSGVTDPTGTDGNISADPKVVSLAYGDMHIQPDSPCVNGGDDAVVQADWTDIDGQARILGAHVDIGADESDGTVWPDGPYAIVRVSSGGNDTNNGSSWALAKRTVQAGVDVAAILGGEVWVQAGTYNERITLPPFAYLYGGFSGTEIARDERDWTVHITILDGQQGGSVVTMWAGDGVSAIDGFTIRSGTGTPTDLDPLGGGIYCWRSSPTIANNTITGNSADEYFGAGGGLYLFVSSATIAYNAIIANSASSGAGIVCSNSSPIIVNNTITANSATYTRGGIYCSSSFGTIANNTITANSASSGGGIYCESSSPTIANNIVAFNSSGVYKTGSNVPTFQRNCVYANTAYDYSGVTDPTGTDGNVSTDPKLVSLAYGDMHIQPDSPCVNAGDDAVVQAGWMDIDSQSRILGSHVDIGADESDGTSWPEGPYAIVRVSPAGNDTNNGSSWALAKRTVQAGISAASVLGGEVWVRAGTYYERITLPPFVYLYGGFSGTEVAREERDRTAHVTILDGQRGGSVVTARTGYWVSTIDGFTIRNGAGAGGGVFCWAGSPTIANNTITANSASPGGGIYLYGALPMIVSNTITGNRASSSSGAGYGGGIYCNYSFPTIANNTISTNIADDRGGGIACDNSSPTITNNTITSNSASPYGGALYLSSSSPTIANNTISANSASSGGGIYCWASSPMIVYNAITANSVSTSGGGIYCNYDSPIIANNTIAANVATGDYSYGGGIYCSSSATIANNAIVGNMAAGSHGYGGGIYSRFASPAITNNTIIANSASSHGAGLYLSEFFSTIANSIVAFNSSGVYRSGGSPVLRYNCVYGNTAYNYSGVTDPTGTSGNLSADPLLVRLASPGPDGIWRTADDDYGDLRLQAGSPCFDAGDDAALPADTADLDGDGDRAEPLPLDLDGRPRIAFQRVDMGAYEYAGAGDFDLDGDVDLDDYAFLAECFTGPLVPDPADHDGDGDVDLDDFVAWAGCMAGPGTAPGAGCSTMDLDGDGDVDAGDFAEFQVSHTGPDAFLPPGCRPADLDADHDVDLDDFAVFQTAFTG